MAWDDTKTVNPGNPDGELTSTEYNNLVDVLKGHSNRHESGGDDEVDHDALLNFVANEHIDHSTIDITAGNALTGGGDLTATRTLNVDEGAVDIGNLAGVLADAVIKSTGDNLAWNTDGSDNLILENTTDGVTLLTWDQDTGDITFEQLTGTPAFSGHDHSEGGLTTVPNAGLTNSSFSLTGGNGLDAIGSISLGGSGTVAIATDGIQTDELDLSITPTWTGLHQFDAGVDTRGDIVDDTTTIYDATAGHVEQSILENDSITITGGNAIDAIGTIALGGSATVDVATDGIATDELDLSITPTWTGEHTYSAGITGLPAPTADSDAARKSYVDAVEQALDIKDSVRAATDGSNVDLSSASDPNPIDGVTLSDGDRVLLKDQTTGSENGVYDAATATDPTTWTRSNDAAEDDEVTAGLFVFVEEGTTNSDRGFVLTTNDPITVGTTALSFTQFSGAGQITAGDGIKKTGDTLNIEPADFAGNVLSDDGADNLDVNLGNGVEDNSGTLRVNPAGFAGDGLKETSATTLGVEPADFAGAGLADDGSDNLTVDTADTGTFTASGGSSPAVDTVVNTSLAQTDAYDVLLYVDSDPAFNADYQFNYDHAHFWDDSAGTLKIDWTVNWDTDPGASNDVSLRWEVIRR